MNIQHRLAQARVSAVADEQDDAKAFAGWKAEIYNEARRKARLEVQDELSSHASVMGRVEAERDAANTRHESAEMKVTEHELKIASLQKGLATVKSSWNATKVELNSGSQELRSTLTDEQLKNEQLKLQLATLEGQLMESKKPVRVAKQKPVAQKPTVIPTFKFEPTRNMDGIATSWTATPIRLN